MNKSILKRVFLLLLPMGIFYSCMTKEIFIPEEKFSPEVTDAQLWYDKQEEKTEGFRMISPDGQKYPPLWPDWKMTFSEEDEQYKYLGVNLGKTTRKLISVSKKEDGTEDRIESEEKFAIVTPECAAKFEETHDNRYMAFSIRMIVGTNKKTNEKHGFVMVAYPDLSYLEVHIDNPLHDITYLKRGEGFSGAIYYYGMDGNYTNGWKYIDGTAYVLHRGEKKED